MMKVALEMKPERWVTSTSKPVKVLGFLGAVRRDIFSKRGIYDYVETLLRDCPGYLGRYFRYKLISRFFGSAGKNVMIDPGNRFKYPYKIHVGNNAAIATGCVFQAAAGIEIGDNTLFGPGVKIWTVNHLFKDTELPILNQGFEGKSVIIGKDCWIGSDVFIKPGTIIPDGCIVYPKTVLGKMNLRPYSVLAGNPAKVVGPRNRIGAFMGWNASPSAREESKQ